MFGKWGDSNLPHLIGNIYGPLSMKLAGIELVVENKEYLHKSLPAVFLCNHQTAVLDLPIGCALLPPHTVSIAKNSLKWIPFFGIMWNASGNVFIVRENRTQAISQLNVIVDRMINKKDSVWLFPEGTRGDSTQLLPFKKGAFHMAVAAQVPIVPVVIAPISKITNYKTKQWNGGKLHVRVLLPIETKGKGEKDVDSLITQVRNEMAKAFDDLRDK